MYYLRVYKSALLLLTASLILVSIIYAESSWLDHYKPIIPKGYRPINNDLTEQLEDIPELSPIIDTRAAYSVITQKPLFIEGRIELQEGQHDAINSGQPLAFSLTGVVLGSNQSYALIADEKKVQHRLTQGDNYAGWLIKQVQADKVVLQNKQVTRELLLIPIETKPQPNYESVNDALEQEVESFPEEIPNIIEQ